MLKKLHLLAVFITACLIAVMINSCKKDSYTDQQNKVSDPAIAQAKSWYESAYPTGSKLSSQATTGNKNLSQLIKPDWQHPASYSRFNQQVIEMPVDPSVKFGSAIKNMTTGQTTNQNYSRSSYILLNNGTSYDAYVMTLIADSAYIKNDPGKLARNTYSKHEADFSGLVLYYTPNGKYVGGYRYKDGHLVVPGAQTATPGTKVQSTGNSKLKPDNMVVPEEDCYDYYDLTYVNGILVLVEYQYSRCFSSGSGGGGGDSGYTPPPPCPPGTTRTQSTSNLVVNNIPPPPPDDGGGFPSPAPLGPCVVVAPPPGSGTVAPPPEGFRPLCKGSIILTPASGNTSEVNMAGIQFGITDLPHFPLYKTEINVISFNLYINIPNQITDPTDRTKSVTITPEMQKEFIYQAYHFASEQINLVHGDDFFSAGAQPKYSAMFATFVGAYLNTLALHGRFPAYENANPGLIPSLGTRTSTQITPSKASLAVYTNLPSGEGC